MVKTLQFDLPVVLPFQQDIAILHLDSNDLVTFSPLHFDFKMFEIFLWFLPCPHNQNLMRLPYLSSVCWAVRNNNKFGVIWLWTRRHIVAFIEANKL